MAFKRGLSAQFQDRSIVSQDDFFGKDLQTDINLNDSKLN